MATLQEILARAQALREETALGSIDPERAGSIMYDTLQVINQMQLNGGALVITKIYASVAAMEADDAPVSDLTGNALKPGQLVVIVTTDTSSSDFGSVYRFDGIEDSASTWSFTGKIGGYPMDETPTEGSTRAVTSGGVYSAVSQLGDDLIKETAYTTEQELEYVSRENNKCLLVDGTEEYSSSAYIRLDTYEVLGGETYKITGRTPTTANACLLAFYDADGVYINGSSKFPAGSAGTPYLDVKVIAPANAAFIKILGSSSQNYLPGAKLVTVLNTVKDKIEEIEEDISEFIPIDISGYSGIGYMINENGYWRNNSSYDAVLLPVDPGKYYKILNKTVNRTYYAILRTNAYENETPVDFAAGYDSRIYISAGEYAVIKTPVDAHYLYIIRNYNGSEACQVYKCNSDIYQRIITLETQVAEPANSTIVEIKLERGGYTSNGQFDPNIILNDAYLCTPNFLKLPKDGAWGVRTDSSATMVILRYFRDDYTFLSGVSATELEASGFTEFAAPSGAAFVKMNFRNESTTDITPGKAYFMGSFEENPIYYNVRPADSGYQTIAVRVRPYNPVACDAATDSVQDDSAESADYGVIAIPAQYVNRGTPTRLIIYCHGAAVNYASGANRFNSQDLDPDYWLSEGYAVMDIEGNPFNNTDEHFAIPQAYQCYKAAYEWVINHYNIRRDGVFLGGRSMGGLMTLDILTQERSIPIIAACPNVPCVVPTWYWNYMNADRRAFCATRLGFVNQPTWTGTSPMPSDEWDCLKANYDKLALASPFWRLLNDLPDKNDIFEGTNVSKSSTDPTPLLNVYGNCRLRVKAPTKLFICRDDTIAIPEMNGDILAKIAKQSGQIFVVREFQTGGHHYDTQNEDLQVTITNSYGVSITTSVVYIEMLSWWKQWEQF